MTWSELTSEQWATPSWCGGWSVQDTAGHVLAAAEQTPLNFYKEMISAGLRFNVFADRAAQRLGAIGPDELVRRLRARTSTTNHPPAPVMAMLGEIVVHGQDIRRPLGLKHDAPEEALVARGRQLEELEPAHRGEEADRRIGTPRHRQRLGPMATGPEVSGPLLALVLAMTGPQGCHAGPAGDGLEILAERP